MAHIVRIGPFWFEKKKGVWTEIKVNEVSQIQERYAVLLQKLMSLSNNTGRRNGKNKFPVIFMSLKFSKPAKILGSNIYVIRSAMYCISHASIVWRTGVMNLTLTDTSPKIWLFIRNSKINQISKYLPTRLIRTQRPVCRCFADANERDDTLDDQPLSNLLKEWQLESCIFLDFRVGDLLVVGNIMKLGCPLIFLFYKLEKFNLQALIS